MEEVIISVIVGSGIIGILSNYLVSLTKYFRKVYKIDFPPRVMNALFSLGGAIGLVLGGGEADMTAVNNALAIIIAAGASWVIAHVTHRINSI